MIAAYCMNIVKILQDKAVKGVDVRVNFFNLGAIIWHAYYFCMLEQWWVFGTTIVMIIEGIIYTTLLVYYSVKQQKMEKVAA